MSIKKLVTAICLLIFISIGTNSCTPVKKYAASNGHSHNDYLNVHPFFNAYNKGFGSIEADVFPINGILYVAHKKEEVQQQHTLKALYLDPLLSELITDSLRQLNLLIDVKENYKDALSLLIQELQPLIKSLSTTAKTKNITITISGNRPPPGEYQNYPGYIFFDDDLKLKHSAEQWQRVHLVSLPFVKLSSWKGEKHIPRKDFEKLKKTTDSVHALRKPIRFWAAPDNASAWKLQMKLRIDLIGTDKINELGNYIRKGFDKK